MKCDVMTDKESTAVSLTSSTQSSSALKSQLLQTWEKSGTGKTLVRSGSKFLSSFFLIIKSHACLLFLCILISLARLSSTWWLFTTACWKQAESISGAEKLREPCQVAHWLVTITLASADWADPHKVSSAVWEAGVRSLESGELAVCLWLSSQPFYCVKSSISWLIKLELLTSTSGALSRCSGSVLQSVMALMKWPWSFFILGWQEQLDGWLPLPEIFWAAALPCPFSVFCCSLLIHDLKMKIKKILSFDVAG